MQITEPALKEIKNYPEFLKPRLRLFLSADIAGSTAAKQKEGSFYKDPSQPRKEKGWIDATVYFFEEFSTQFDSTWNSANSAFHSVPGSKEYLQTPPVYWKAIGDEILYYKEISRWEEIWVAIGAWAVAIKEVRRELQTRFRSLGLDIKGSAWIAGFPVINTELVLNAQKSNPATNEQASSTKDFPIYSNLFNLYRLYESPNDGYTGERDFIGPLIDAGFRVSSQATPGRLVISIETAYAILGTRLSNEHVKAIESQVKEFPQLQFYYAGRRQLKGVSGSSGGYPLFFVDLGLPKEDLYSTEAVLLEKVNGKVNEQDALNFCEKYFTENPSSCRPYIVNEDGVLLGGEMPRGHIVRLDELHNLWLKISTKSNLPIDALPPDSGGTPEGDKINEVQQLAGITTKRSDDS